MSRALQKSGGHLFPTGWWHLLKGLYGKNDMVDLLMVAVAPEYQNKGVNSMLFTDLVPIFVDSGYKWAESNLELADNQSVQQQWKFFEHRLHKRRCTFRKKIE
jgi:GNAT superfamily N-acetyltransferase